MKENFYVYILSNQSNRVVYTGVTSNLVKRIWQHKNKVADGFTSKYNVNKLVYFENHDDAENAIKREKNIKDWKRAWKNELIEKENPDWRDLYDDITQ
ncbi:MAG: GIY-YIG nuclease family protein [Alphaproteobacteria bacterium]|nr:GIY-YIG nuclease family protein [Alphaproteobacteria bacterium]